MSRTIILFAVALAAFGGAYLATSFTNGAPEGMVWIPGGEFTMGTNDDIGWPDEKPAHRVKVSGFNMDVTEVTNAQFRKFVEATKYVTTAEKAPALEEIMQMASIFASSAQMSG